MLNEPVAEPQPEGVKVPLTDTVSEPDGLPELLADPIAVRDTDGLFELLADPLADG